MKDLTSTYLANIMHLAVNESDMSEDKKNELHDLIETAGTPGMDNKLSFFADLRRYQQNISEFEKRFKAYGGDHKNLMDEVKKVRTDKYNAVKKWFK